MYNERWFLARQALLDNGKVEGKLKSQLQWQYLLKGQKKQEDCFVQHSRELAANFLSAV